MTVPTDIDSFCGGVDLTAANYSGGAGGTFADLVAGRPAWTVVSATPSFSTKSGSGWSIEGVDFSGVAGESVICRGPFLWEGTVVLIGQVVGTRWMMGGTYIAGNSWGLQHASGNVQFYNALNSSGYTSSGFNVSAPNVLSISNCPETGKTYAQANDGAVVSSTNATKASSRITWHEVAIGRHRTTYLTGWVARALFFSRALHERDNTALQSLIATEMAKIGL